ncbi:MULTISPECIES: hypothetical protein [unclassified Actinopolyspora]|uniref:hypothetical protein n=1 Tax=unclassified Actinopolyspora TaxID=2639451 RepID=UPI0013F67477|nr:MULTISPECIES: hypothetical protein [unclassified Actinopolyspora]NHD16132.1 hypothetical protein [Actinopolyspora sp. BKK2]NHE74654.1 hypothetical protein [Actinopolyspora sp. BKK1]
MFDRSSRPVANLRPVGNTALLAAALIAVIQLVTDAPAQSTPNLIAVLLCVVGQGMRIESAIAEQRSDR